MCTTAAAWACFWDCEVSCENATDDIGQARAARAAVRGRGADVDGQRVRAATGKGLGLRCLVRRRALRLAGRRGQGRQGADLERARLRRRTGRRPGRDLADAAV